MSNPAAIVRPQFAFRRQWRRRVSILMMTTLAWAALPSPADAETLYVTDILRLGLHRAADTGDSPFRTLVSGDELEVLEKSRFYARVRTTDGQVGWVKASYLVDEKPAQSRLADLTGERDALAEQLKSLRARLQQQDAELATLRDERDRLQRQLGQATGQVNTLSASNQELTTKVAQTRYSVPMRWVVMTAALMLFVGLIAGWWWCDYRYRQRHGGFRL